MKGLRGKHNWQNAAMTYAAAHALGMSADAIKFGMASFPGLAHRMQEIGKAGPVAFVNDSKATNADAAEKALSSFDNIFWIVGGVAKAGGIGPLKPLFKNVRKAYLIGVAATEFSKTLDGVLPFDVSCTLDVAVKRAADDARNSSLAQPVVLLSPACASFDQYKNFEIRGDAFVKAVAAVSDITMFVGDTSA
jgi:UDP-N-acetylmuramoylalanine--D-glutamate ligase